MVPTDHRSSGGAYVLLPKRISGARYQIVTTWQQQKKARAANFKYKYQPQSTSEARKRSHHARPGQVSIDKRSYKLATLAVEGFGSLGKERSDLIDQVAASIVGGTDGSSLARTGVCNERLFQNISVTTHVAISRRVHRYKLPLGDRQAARGREEEAGGLRPMT